MPEIGQIALILSAVTSAYAVVMALVGKFTRKNSIVASAERAAMSTGGLLVISAATLIYSFVTRDFSLEYVASYSNRALPLIYTISGWWAGNQGSLLMWATFLSVYTLIVVVQNQHKNRELMPYVVTILQTIVFAFVMLLLTIAKPFARLPFTPADGKGLNPMLHNPGMYLHPPTTYLGYVGFAIPFAFAMAALLSGRLNDLWIRTTRRWTLWAWFWLTIGNLVGAWWAYYTLGWGGYWGWDPVENSSFMPWLIGTAYLHSVMIQEKKGMLKIWNMMLITMAFSLTIYGTLITRSGIINSVHTFSQSGLGPYLIVMLFTVLAGAVILILYRLPMLQSDNELDSLVSRESAFLFNNVVLIGFAFMVLWGTTFPFISEAVTGNKITVGPPFYDQMAVPLGMGLLFLIGFCPLVAWRRASIQNLHKNFLYPLAAAFVAGVLLVVGGVVKAVPLAAFVLCVFVLATIALEFYRGTRARHNMVGEDYLTALINLIWRNKRRYGGYIVHIGIVFIFVAVAGGPFKTEMDATLKPGQVVNVRGYSLRYQQVIEYPSAEKDTQAASMELSRGGKSLGMITPRKELYKSEQQPWTRVAVKSSLLEDFYVIFTGVEKDGTAGFKIIINPLMQWLWIAGFTATFGATIAFWPDAAEKRRLSMIYARHEEEHANAN